MDFLQSLIGRPNTIKTYTSLFNKYIKNEIVINGKWSDQDIPVYIRSWQLKGLSSSTIKILTSLLCKCIKWQTGQELCIKQALRTVAKQAQETSIETPPKDTLYKLLEASQGTDLHYPYAIALFTGMRKGEVMGLKWSDVDFAGNLLTVQRSYNGPTKNGKTRKIPLHPDLRKLLLDICPKNSDNYLEKGIVPKQFDPNKHLQRLCKRINIKPFTFHTLRHAFASYGLESGVGFNKIQKILGHSNLSTTVNFYWTSAFKPEEVDLTFI
jgi:integrase